MKMMTKDGTICERLSVAFPAAAGYGARKNSAELAGIVE
jgi:hypothetical protein